MDYKMAEIEQIELQANCINDKRRVAFHLINGWCEQCIRNKKKISEITEKLLKILRDCGCNETAMLLQKNSADK